MQPRKTTCHDPRHQIIKKKDLKDPNVKMSYEAVSPGKPRSSTSPHNPHRPRGCGQGSHSETDSKWIGHKYSVPSDDILYSDKWQCSKN